MNVFFHSGYHALAAQIGTCDDRQSGFNLVVHQLFIAVRGEQNIPEWEQAHSGRQNRQHKVVLNYNTDHSAHCRQEQRESADGGKLPTLSGEDQHLPCFLHGFTDALWLFGVVDLLDSLGNRLSAPGKRLGQFLCKCKGGHAQNQEDAGQHPDKGQQNQYNHAVSSFPVSSFTPPPAIRSSRRGGIPFSKSRFCRLAEIVDTF